MNKLCTLKASLVVAGLLALPLAQAATSMSKVDYRDAKSRISADYKTDKAGCAALSANAKDVCIQEAKAKEKVARAELEYGYTGKVGDRNKVAEVKAKSTYAVAKEKCDDQAGNAKDVCVKEAKAIEIKALADAKLTKDTGDARTDAAADKNNADYKVAIEKCDALMGDAKTSCVNAAKTRFGKS